jgi:hypothetical protein
MFKSKGKILYPYSFLYAIFENTQIFVLCNFCYCLSFRRFQFISGDARFYNYAEIPCSSECLSYHHPQTLIGMTDYHHRHITEITQKGNRQN